jgi:hypothetical protein
MTKQNSLIYHLGDVQSYWTSHKLAYLTQTSDYLNLIYNILNRNTLHRIKVLQIQDKVKVKLRPTISRSVRLGVEAHLGLMTGYKFLFDIYCFIDVRHPLWREVGSVIYIIHLNCFSSVILLLAFASYFISDCIWSAFFTSKRHKPSHLVKVAVHAEGYIHKILRQLILLNIFSV